MNTTAYIGMGSNLDDREDNLFKALESVQSIDQTEIETFSGIFESEPMYLSEQPDYLNMVAGLSTQLTPQKLLESLLSIENDMGRVRGERYGPRLIDLDILFFGEEIVKSDSLQIPHPLLYDRLFVLNPLCDIAEEFVCPVKNKSVKELLDSCSDSSRISRYENIVSTDSP